MSRHLHRQGVAFGYRGGSVTRRFLWFGAHRGEHRYIIRRWMLDPFDLRSGQAVERWAFAFCVQPINHQLSTINYQLLSLAADLELIEKRVVLFAIPIEDSHTFDLSAARQLSSRQLDYLLVFHGLNLKIVSVRSGQGHGY